MSTLVDKALVYALLAFRLEYRAAIVVPCAKVREEADELARKAEKLLTAGEDSFPEDPYYVPGGYVPVSRVNPSSLWESPQTAPPLNNPIEPPEAEVIPEEGPPAWRKLVRRYHRKKEQSDATEDLPSGG